MSASPILTITETEPTPLLRDFGTFIQYLGTHHIVLTRTNEFISSKDLHELNQKMTYPVPNTTPKTSQIFYPPLHLFYHLILAGKLFQKSSEKGGRLALKPIGRLQLYEELKPAEKYFFLLETFWTDADWKKLQGGCLGRSPLDSVPLVLEYLSQQQPGKEIRLKYEKETSRRMFWDWEYFFLYFSFFGFWEVTPDKDAIIQYASKRAFKAESIIPSVFGVTIAPILREARDLLYWNLPSRRKLFGEWKVIPGSPLPSEDMYKSLEEELKPKRSKTIIKVDKGEPGDPFFLPFILLFAKGGLQKTLPREGIKFVDGTYIFKVSLAKDLWRRIKVSANHTLFDLHRVIQEAYNFDDDHLYSFFMDGEPWSDERFSSPYDEEGPFVDDVHIGELGLFVGQTILYLFDYGDQWCFGVELEDIRPEGPRVSKPKIVEKKGKAPEQYP